MYLHNILNEIELIQDQIYQQVCMNLDLLGADLIHLKEMLKKYGPYWNFNPLGEVLGRGSLIDRQLGELHRLNDVIQLLKEHKKYMEL